MKNLARNIFSLATAVALGVPLSSFAAASSTAPAASPGPSLKTQPNNLDTQLDSIFTKTFQGMGDWFNQSKMSASFDLRDQKDKYVARIYLPKSDDTSKVSARVENGALHVTTGGEQSSNGVASANRFEEIMSLPGPVQTDKVQVEHKKNLVVVTLPKAPGASTTAQATPAASPNGLAENANDWDQGVVNQIARMQGRMDQMMQEAFPHDLFGTASTVNLGSAVNVDDRKNEYVVRFYLPDRNLADVNVKLNNGQLDLNAKENSDRKTGTTNLASNEQYEQMITLPGPVKDEGMKVDRKDATIVVTVPKA